MRRGNYAVIWKDSGGVKLQRFNSLGQTQGAQLLIDGETSPGVVAIAMNDAGAMAMSLSNRRVSAACSRLCRGWVAQQQRDRLRSLVGV